MKIDFFNNFLTGLKVDLMEEFDKNFERKGFFNDPWKQTRFPNRRGSLMMRTGALRRSLRATVSGHSVRFFSSLPYASIHNEGGTITVTAKMKRFFWAMYYKTSGTVTKTAKGQSRNTARNRAFVAEAGYWKAMALKKIGSKIKIEQRQFLGPHQEVDQVITGVIQRSMKDFETYIHQKLQQ